MKKEKTKSKPSYVSQKKADTFSESQNLTNSDAMFSDFSDSKPEQNDKVDITKTATFDDTIFDTPDKSEKALSNQNKSKEGSTSIQKLISSKCPSCGSELFFNFEKTLLTCRHCNKEVEITCESGILPKIKFDENTIAPLFMSGFSQYECNHCGVRSSSEKKVIKNCPSCGSHEIRKTIDITYEPLSVVPFKIGEQQAELKFSKWIKKKKLAPREFKKSARPQSFYGVYIPAWNFDTEVATTYSGVGVNVKTDSSGKRTYETRHRFKGTTKNRYEDYIQFADKQDNHLDRKLGHFGLEQKKPFRIEFMYGYDTYKTKCDLSKSWSISKKEIKSSEDSAIKSSQHYDRIESYSSDSVFYDNKYELTYLPVYQLKYFYKNKEYDCFMNGYSGYVTGKAPISALKVFLATLLSIVGISLVILIIFLLSR